MMNLDAVEMDDVTQIFFKHTSPISHLVDLEHQQLAPQFGEAQGTEDDYVLLDNALKKLDFSGSIQFFTLKFFFSSTLCSCIHMFMLMPTNDVLVEP